MHELRFPCSLMHVVGTSVPLSHFSDISSKASYLVFGWHVVLLMEISEYRLSILSFILFILAQVLPLSEL